MDVKDSVAVVTGGAVGIGERAVKLLSDLGAEVALVDIDEVKSKRIEDTIKNVRYYECDISKQEKVTKTIGEISEKYNKVDILVNTAGINISGRLEAFDITVKTNSIGLISVSDEVSTIMKRNNRNRCGERGVIVNAGSVTSFGMMEGRNPYLASKGAITLITNTLAKRFLADGIRVNTITSDPFTIPAFGITIDDLKALTGKEELKGQESFAVLVKKIIETPIMNGMIFYLDPSVLWA